MDSLFDSGARPLSLAIAVGLLIFIVWTLMRMLNSQNQSLFRKYEHESPRLHRSPSDVDSAQPRDEEARSILELEGFSFDRKPHEILGIEPGASKTEIQRAFKKLMLRYHPDRVGPPNSREWKDAQPIADAIIRAKDEMLSKK